MGAAPSRRLLAPTHPCPLCGKRSVGPGCHVRIHADLSPSCRGCWEHAYYSPASFRRRIGPALAGARARDTLVL